MKKYNKFGEEIDKNGEAILGAGSQIMEIKSNEPNQDSFVYTIAEANKRLQSELPNCLRKRILPEKPRYDPPNRTDFSEEGTRLLEEWRELQRRKQQEQHDAIARRTLIESEHWKIEAEKNRLEKEKREYNEKYGAWL